MKRFSMVAVVLAIMLIGGNAFALTFDDPNDFTVINSTKWVWYDIFPGIDLTINAYNEAGYDWPITWDSSDYGIGIKDDEVSGGWIDGQQHHLERLRFTFSEAVFIDEFYIVDLFPNENNGNGEIGRYRIDGTSPTISFGPGDNAGNFTLSINQQLEYIQFFADSNRVNDFAVSGFDGAPVPEPGTIVLMGTGLLGLALYGRRKKSHQK